jgi:hypothetical protein
VNCGSSLGLKSTFAQSSPKTWLWYRFGIEAIKKSAVLGKLKLNEIGPEQVADYASERHRDGLQISFINSCLRGIAGHSNISISQRYVHPSEDAVLTALSRLSGHNSRHNAERMSSATAAELTLNGTVPES